MRPMSSFMSATTTLAPASANSRAVAAPMPWAAPVTMATFPSSTRAVISIYLLLLSLLIVRRASASIRLRAPSTARRAR
ncbi:hypothetical protein D3C85_1842990 [compost metagenome]